MAEKLVRASHPKAVNSWITPVAEDSVPDSGIDISLWLCKDVRNRMQNKLGNGARLSEHSVTAYGIIGNEITEFSKFSCKITGKILEIA